MHILDKIVAQKRIEIERNKSERSYAALEKDAALIGDRRSLKDNLIASSTGIIAEFKKKSPSKGNINKFALPHDIAAGYQRAGASAISVLTDEQFFGGSDSDLRLARGVVDLPILRKDFIIDEYQILQARAMDADVILLIARILTPQRSRELASFAAGLGLEVLLEIHSEKELEDHLHDVIDVIGINNRDLDTFKVDVSLSFKLADRIPSKHVKISESGLESSESIIELRRAGFRGFLIGESFMKNSDPEMACALFIQEINEKLAG